MPEFNAWNLDRDIELLCVICSVQSVPLLRRSELLVVTMLTTTLAPLEAKNARPHLAFNGDIVVVSSVTTNSSLLWRRGGS